MVEGGMVVLGSATAHHEEIKNWMQVRGADQAPYPSQLHGASLATAMQRRSDPVAPCKFRKSSEKEPQIRSFVVPADGMGVVGHTQKTQTPMSSAK